ncbi:MAG TPA: GNAT family N-acetyltransferase [Pseudonocardiaceae bacterium]
MIDLDLDLGDGLRLRNLGPDDVDLVVAGTATETAPALWGPRPRGPYSADEAASALREWAGSQVSYGLIRDGALLGAVGLMHDGPGSAELAYWVRPESRRQGLALRGIVAITGWAHRDGGLPRVWVEINPDNTASRSLAERAGFSFEQRAKEHCRAWSTDDPATDTWHDCLIFGQAG